MGRPVFVKTKKEAQKYQSRIKAPGRREVSGVNLVVLKNMLRKIENRLGDIEDKLYQMKEGGIW